MKQASVRELRQTLRSAGAPFSVVWEITTRCNLRCIHCYQGKPGNELRSPEAFSLLDQLAASGCLKLTLTGGEPTLREDFPELLDRCHRKGFAVTVFTNATWSSPEIRSALKKRPLYGVECSLYGATPAVHEQVAGVTGSYARTLENIRWMVKEGLRVTVKSVILRPNSHELAALRRLAAELGVAFQSTFRVFPSQDPAKRIDALRIRSRELEALAAETWPARDSGSGTGEFLCNAGREACCVSAEGKVYPCVALRWECGDLRKSAFADIWSRSRGLEKIRRYREEDFGECYACELRANCDFCPGLGFGEHGDMLVPSKEICRLTRARNGSRR